MDNLYDVHNCLSAMDSSKATERKKSATQLEQLLDRESVIEIINNNTAHGTGKRLITWDVVLKGVNRYIDTEITALQSAKESQSTITLNNREKKKQELSALFKLVIKSANKGSAKLSFQLLIDRIESMLKDTYTQEAFGIDYSLVFLKYVLRVRSYWLTISPDKWRRFTNLFCNLFNESKLERGILARIIQDLIRGSCLQSQLYPRKVFTFFTRVMENIRELKDTSVIENILTALNIFCKAVAPNSRVQLCCFGEGQMNEFIFLWGRHSDKIKEELVELLHLQVRIHHPGGATDPCAGAYAYNWEMWKKQVTFLHEMVVTDIDKITDRYKFISGSNVITSAYINFAADVFKQMPVCKLVSPDFVLPSSQASQSGNHGDTVSAGPAKRKRLSTESKSLLEIVSDCSNTLQAVPWLQVLHNLLNKYPRSFGDSGLTTTLQAMAVLLAECKKGQLYRYIFEVLSALIRAIQHCDGLKDKVYGMITAVWSHCVSTINSRQAEVEGYQEHGFCAMASMINSGLVSPTKEIWNLFLPTFSHPSDTADQLLTSLIIAQGLPESYVPSIIGAPFDKRMIRKSPTFPLRQSLITWLLPVVDAENGSQSKTALCPLRSAEILYALTLQDPSVIQNGFFCPTSSNNSFQSSVLETTYLKSTFDHQAFKGKENCLQMVQKMSSSQNRNPQIPVVLEFLVNHLFTLSSNLDQQTSEFLTWYSSLVVRLLYYLWEENTAALRIQSILKKVLKKMADNLVSQVQKEIPSCLSSNLALLSAALTWDEEGNTRMFLVVELVRSCLPVSFVDMLLDIINGKMNRRKDSNSDLSKTPLSRNLSSTNRRETASTSRIDDDMDFDMFDMAGSSRVTHSNGSGKDFADEDSLNDTQDVSSPGSQDTSDFLKKQNLTETDQLRILCTEVLCRLTSYDRHQMDMSEDELVVKTEINCDSVNARLLQLISSECYDPCQALHIHFLLTISKHLLTCSHEVSLKDIKIILTAFKQTAKQQVEDQQVCCKIISHMRYIIPYLCGGGGRSPASDQLKFCRDVYLKFVSDFWRLSSDSTPNLKLEIAETLLDLLKYDPDCTWGHLQIATNDEETAGFNFCTVASHFPKLLSDGCILLRTFVAESLKWLFVLQDALGREIFPDKNTQKKAFECVFELCTELLDFEQGNLSEHRWKDELCNRQATCLQSLLTIIVASPVCEKECLLGLCQVVAEKTIPLDPVKKMLNIICQELKFADIQSYLTCHLPYLIHNWLDQKMVNSPISQFPYKLLGYENLEQFIRSHQDLIVSELLVTKRSIADVHTVLDPIHINVHDALKSGLPHILTHVLPAFATNLIEDADGLNSHTSNASREFAKATDCFTIVVSELSDKIIKDCAYEKIGDIIVRILNCLSLDKELPGKRLLSMGYPEPNPPHYNHERIQRTLDYLAQSFMTGGKDVTLITVLAKTQDSLYQVLLSLSSLLCHEHRAHEQQRLLQMYGLFVNMLLKELCGGLEGGWASLIRDVINRLLFVLEDRAHSVVSISSPSYEEEVILTTLDILRALCSTALETCPDEMANYVHRIIDTVAGVATLSGRICKSVVDFLTVVLMTSVVEVVDELAKAVKILNPLPATPGLSHLRTRDEKMNGESQKPLTVQLDNLLEVCFLMCNNPSPGLAKRINQLTNYIVRNHSEMQQLVRKPEGLLIVKNTLTELLKLVTSSHPEVAAASAACLGAIGPIDLQSLSFPRWPGRTSHAVAMEHYKGSCYEKYCWLFHALNNCLLDKSLQVVKTAGVILKKILATPTGAHFEADYMKSLKDKSFLFHYLHPFKAGANKSFVMSSPPAQTESSVETFKMLVDKLELWLGSKNNLNTSHECWIQSLTTSLLATGAVRDEALKMIGPMCSVKNQFCEESLPFLIHDILQGGDAEIRKVIFSNISSFFHCHCISAEAQSGSSAAYPSCMNKQSVRTMLSVVQYLRKQKSPQERQEVPQTSWNKNFWLDVDYLEVARAALYCAANFSAVLFAEIWWDIQKNSEKRISSSGSSLSSQTSDIVLESQFDPLIIVSSQGKAGQKLQELLLEAYRNIGDPDGIYGCGAGKLAQPMARVQTYLHEQQHEKALTTLDIGISHSTPSVAMLLQTVESCGADYILQWCLSELSYIRCESPASSSKTSVASSAGVTGELEEFHYQAAWKLGQWDCHLPAKHDKPAPFQQSLYQAMVSLKDDHLNIAKEFLNKARTDVVKRFDLNVESCKSLYPFLSDLQCLTYLEQVLETLPKLIKSSCEELLNLFAASTDKAFITTQAVHFDNEKPLLHLMASVAKVLASKGTKQGETLEIRSLWSLAVGGRKARQFQLAEKAIHNLKSKIRSENSTVTLEHVHLEEAKLFWARSEVDIAKNILKNLIFHLGKASSGDVSRQLYPEALCTYGNWLAETRSETPTVVIRDYFEKTVALMNESDPQLPHTSDYTALEGLVSLARFADEQYQQVADHIRSPTFEDKQNLLVRLRAELKACQEFKSQSKYVKTMEKTLALDQQEIQSLQESLGHFLQQALLNYLKCLKLGDAYNLKVFRVVALWFENFENTEVNLLIKEYIEAIKTYKFLPLYYQLAARMSSVVKDNCNFQPVLTELMERVAKDHPHHALWIVIALAHAYKDDELLTREQTGRNRRKTSTDDKIEEERVQAAKIMLDKLRQTDQMVAKIVTNMETLCTAYIELANWTVPNKTSRNPQPLHKDLTILRTTGFDNILLPSVELQVDPTGAYKHIISPVRFGTHLRVVGGINLPKIITCVGSDGRERTQLVKGQDDLRQDAVMQQIFTLVNELLAGDVESRKRQLKIQTYKVIPLSQKCGLLQWCEGTKPLGEYLIGTIGSSGAHSRYRSQDWSVKTCREHLQGAGTTAENRLKAYNEICSKFKPVFRHFFMEKFLEANVWFEKRLAYTRSVATNSIVGYILGLGDRHLMNILIDLHSAEVVHIDLGIAFEQGRILPTPETVPFRLTRDIVDGMGVTGVEGVFRRCCEKTMEVMKHNSESLLTVIQVLLYDPLSHWSLTPQQALAIQRKREQENLDTLDISVIASGQVPSSGLPSSGAQGAGLSGLAGRDISSRNNDLRETQNKMAERTLLRLRQKLGGQEDGVPLSVNGQVNLLIQKASDPVNLSMLYAGWQPYL